MTLLPRSCAAALLALLALAAATTAAAAPTKRFSLTKIQFADLVTLDAAAAQAAADELTSVGAIQITGIPRFGAVRKRALEDLAECFEAEGADVTLMMADGAERTSCGAASHEGAAGPMSHFCGEASEKLRATVDAATRQLFVSLDAASAKAGVKPASHPVMEPAYASLSQLMARGEHLEHMHVYSGAVGASVNPATLNYHVDAGLMIAMTTGYYSEQPSDASGLYLVLPDGSRAKAVAEDDALIVLMGDGAAHWLSPMFAKPFHAPAHALIAALPSGASRSWYGKMYLPPADAVIPKERVTFAQFHALQVQHSAPLSSVAAPGPPQASELAELLPSACGGRLVHAYGPAQHAEAAARHLGVSVVADNCPANTIMCWAQCMDVATLSCGTDAVCWDEEANQPFPNPSEMCMHDDGSVYCQPECKTSNSTFDGYCFGSGTSMFMQGFVSIVQEGESQTACVNLLFKEWTLDSKGKYAAACLGVFCMCIAIQYLASLRGVLNKNLADGPLRRLANVALYALHVTLGYFAMLVAMTYSVELFCMICAGLTAGFALFHLGAPMDAKSTDPCCGEIEEDDFTYQNLEDQAAKALSAPINPNPSSSEDYGNCCAEH